MAIILAIILMSVSFKKLRSVSDLGRASEAEPLDAEALRLKREVLGDKHSGTLLSLNNLSHVRMDLPSQSHLAVEPARSLMSNIRAARKVAGYLSARPNIMCRSAAKIPG
ncbi:tetratricopeptide repeat protein [Parasphingorhabdus sp.]|uniref:tetratricopeptide repeat protein n=1 Tax=Parasphingorhabdus sp. TaxID=2709688 RepID=UPI003002AB25